MIAGAPAAARAPLKRYGAALGAAFQIADDLLDAEGDAATLGKRVGKDAGRNKATFVAALGLEGARVRRDALVAEATRRSTRRGWGRRARRCARRRGSSQQGEAEAPLLQRRRVEDAAVLPQLVQAARNCVARAGAEIGSNMSP